MADESSSWNIQNQRMDLAMRENVVDVMATLDDMLDDRTGNTDPELVQIAVDKLHDKYAGVVSPDNFGALTHDVCLLTGAWTAGKLRFPTSPDPPEAPAKEPDKTLTYGPLDFGHPDGLHYGGYPLVTLDQEAIQEFTSHQWWAVAEISPPSIHPGALLLIQPLNISRRTSAFLRDSFFARWDFLHNHATPTHKLGGGRVGPALQSADGCVLLRYMSRAVISLRETKMPVCCTQEQARALNLSCSLQPRVIAKVEDEVEAARPIAASTGEEGPFGGQGLIDRVSYQGVEGSWIKFFKPPPWIVRRYLGWLGLAWDKHSEVWRLKKGRDVHPLECFDKDYGAGVFHISADLSKKLRDQAAERKRRAPRPGTRSRRRRGGQVSHPGVPM